MSDENKSYRTESETVGFAPSPNEVPGELTESHHEGKIRSPEELARRAAELGSSAAMFPPIPGFEIIGEIGRGGMGLVCRARDVALDREVAIKFLQDQYAPNSPGAMRFVEEARITGQLQHPGIPAVHQVGTLSDGRPYLAMKLIKGRTLDELLKDRAAGAPQLAGGFRSDLPGGRLLRTPIMSSTAT